MRIKLPSNIEALAEEKPSLVIISDIDKTYLKTNIESLAALIKTAFEAPERKNIVPGFPILLRALKRGGGSDLARHHLFFLSASPPQMKDKLLKKMKIDGVYPEGLIFKNQLDHVKTRAFKKLREQVGYKLLALLKIYKIYSLRTHYILFGDDSESDVIIYDLFQKIITGKIDRKFVDGVLQGYGVFRQERVQILWELRSLKTVSLNPVQQIFINLETGSQDKVIESYASNILATRNTFEQALFLCQNKRIRLLALKSIKKELESLFDYNDSLLRQYADKMLAREHISEELISELWS